MLRLITAIATSISLILDNPHLVIPVFLTLLEEILPAMAVKAIVRLSARTPSFGAPRWTAPVRLASTATATARISPTAGSNLSQETRHTIDVSASYLGYVL